MIFPPSTSTGACYGDVQREIDFFFLFLGSSRLRCTKHVHRSCCTARLYTAQHFPSPGNRARPCLPDLELSLRDVRPFHAYAQRRSNRPGLGKTRKASPSPRHGGTSITHIPEYAQPAGNGCVGRKTSMRLCPCSRFHVQRSSIHYLEQRTLNIERICSSLSVRSAAKFSCPKVQASFSASSSFPKGPLIPSSRIFFRSVFRLMPSSSAARTWLPPVFFITRVISGFSTR